MNKYLLMLAAAGLIAAAPAYYAFQAHANENAPLPSAVAPPTVEEEAAADEAAATEEQPVVVDEAAPPEQAPGENERPAPDNDGIR